MKSLRETVSELMVTVHLIAPELADQRVAQMDEVELRQRFRQYTGTELSVVGPRTRAANVSSTRFSRPATMTAGLRHSTLFPELPTERDTGQRLPDSEVKNRVRDRSRA